MMDAPAGAAHVMRQLSHDDIAYAADPARGGYRGFAALHDLMDANMLYPQEVQAMICTRETSWKGIALANAIADLVSQEITGETR